MTESWQFLTQTQIKHLDWIIHVPTVLFDTHQYWLGQRSQKRTFDPDVVTRTSKQKTESDVPSTSLNEPAFCAVSFEEVKLQSRSLSQARTGFFSTGHQREPSTW